MRAALLALGLSLLAGCQIDPPGECAATPDCEAGLTCQGGVCVGCGGDTDCGGWQACSTARRCLSRPGFCSADGECDAWAACGVDHTCALRTGQCGDGADCHTWEACTAHRCIPLPGRCSAQSDCAWYQACRPSPPGPDLPQTCGLATLLDGAAVHLWGALDATCSTRAVAPAEHPEQARVGFDCAGQGAPAAIGPEGDLYYTSGTAPARGVSRLVPDPAPWSAAAGRWLYPTGPSANDLVVVAATACGPAGLDHWLLRSFAGGVRYACAAAGGTFDYFDPAGVLQYSGDRVVAWTSGDVKLVTGAAGWRLVDAGNLAHAVAGLGPSVEALAARAHGSAIWVVDGAGFGAPRRYSVGADAVARYEGTFAAVPAGIGLAAPGGETAVLDGSGQLVQRGDAGGVTVVLRRPLAPAAASVIYRQAPPAGSNAFTSAAGFEPFVLLQGGPLVTGF